jgi:hypothetical protein
VTNKAPAPITNATPEEKLATIFQDQALRNQQRQRDTGTFLSHTQNDEGGRFAKPTQVVGAKPLPEYPRQPEGSFSNQAAVMPIEEPLGFVDEPPIVGEAHEVAASIDRLDAAPATASGHLPPEAIAVESRDLAIPRPFAF